MRGYCAGSIQYPGEGFASSGASNLPRVHCQSVSGSPAGLYAVRERSDRKPDGLLSGLYETSSQL